MIRLVHHHGYPVGFQIGGRLLISDGLYRRAERLAGCSSAEECARRHAADHAAWRARNGLPPIYLEDE